MSAVSKWLDWITARERRATERQEALPLVAHYWDGGAPVAHQVRDISPQGMYLLTRQRWYPGTVVMLSLQREDLAESDPARTISVNARVVRSGQDGVGFSFVLCKDPHANNKKDPHTSDKDVLVGTDKKSFETFLRKFRESHGQSLVEYILMLPLIFLLIVNVINFGGFFYAWITVANAARAGADYGIMSGASVGFPAQPSAASISSLITQDLASLPNSGSVTVKSCISYVGTVKDLASGGSCTISPTPPADPESSTYALITIDVAYTYQPFIPMGFQFPNLHIYATLPPSTFHQQAFMRVLQ